MIKKPPDFNLLNQFFIIFSGLFNQWMQKLDVNREQLFFKILFSISIIYLFGLLWLGTLIGWDKPIFKLGLLPFVYAEMLKILLLTLIVNKVKNFRKFI